MRHHKTWIVSVMFCDMRYIIHTGYLLGDTTLEPEPLNKPGKNDVKFLYGRSPSAPNGFSRFRILSDQTPRNIDLGEDLLVHY